MTDLTNQDLRHAREWADEMSGHPILNENARAAVRYVLATVDAPAPTLAEELRDVADNYGMSSRAADRLNDIADRVEHDLAEAHAEVERLTAERHTERPDDNDWLAGMKEATRYAINATRPDPADVKPGEPWLIRAGGHEALAVRDGDPFWAWSAAHLDGGIDDVADESVTLISRMVPAPRVITNADDLDRAKRCTIIRDSVGVVCERAVLGDGWFTTQNGTDQTPYIELPATVLWEPEA